MRGNVSDLRRDLNSVRKQLEDNTALKTARTYVAHHTPNVPAVTSKAPIPTEETRVETVEEAEAEEISEPATLNLNDIGRQMIEKALERNKGNRKKAAQELGISDRTLYRRIKQYGLE